MLNIIDRPEKLWQECTKLAKSQGVIKSELFGAPNDHFVLAYGPVAQRNQYQALLYSASNQFNVSILPINDLALCGEIPWPSRVICHFHWIHGQTSLAKTEAEASAAVIYWKRLIERIKDNGHKIVWTVHNVIPHETAWIEQDKKIHQMMADAADALHVMASDSSKLTEKYYTLDEHKIFVVPHPTYDGAQPDNITRTEARAQLRITKEEFVFLSFGAIMEYKGYDQLMEVYEQVRVDVPKKTRLIIAGLPSDKALVERISKWGRTKADVILHMAPVPNEKLQVYFRAADVAVCPYRRTMNSGAAFMALTFELPVIGPNSGSFADLIRDGCAFGYDINHQEQLGILMKNIIKVDFSTIKNSLRIKRADFSPLLVSKSFFNKILNLNG